MQGGLASYHVQVHEEDLRTTSSVREGVLWGGGLCTDSPVPGRAKIWNPGDSGRELLHYPSLLTFKIHNTWKEVCSLGSAA